MLILVDWVRTLIKLKQWRVRAECPEIQSFKSNLKVFHSNYCYYFFYKKKNLNIYNWETHIKCAVEVPHGNQLNFMFKVITKCRSQNFSSIAVWHVPLRHYVSHDVREDSSCYSGVNLQCKTWQHHYFSSYLITLVTIRSLLYANSINTIIWLIDDWG